MCVIGRVWDTDNWDCRTIPAHLEVAIKIKSQRRHSAERQLGIKGVSYLLCREDPGLLSRVWAERW